MPDIKKFKNISLQKETYSNLDKIRKVIVPGMVVSRSQTITLLVNEKVETLNGKIKKG